MRHFASVLAIAARRSASLRRSAVERSSSVRLDICSFWSRKKSGRRYNVLLGLARPPNVCDGGGESSTNGTLLPHRGQIALRIRVS
jgi:hypothetical protein